MNKHVTPPPKKNGYGRPKPLIFKPHIDESLGSKFPHLKSSCMAFLLRVSGEDVAVVIGQWQGVFFTEWDGGDAAPLKL